MNLVEYPKSHTLRQNYLSINMFSTFMSLCEIFLLCKCSMAFISYLKKYLAISSGKFEVVSIIVYNSPYSAISMT